MIYTMNVTVRVAADTEREATSFIKHALSRATKQEVEYLDAEVLEVEDDPDQEEPCLPDGTPIFRSRKMTHQEYLQGWADRGVDTWAEYRGER